MYEDILATVPLFRDLSPRELTWLPDTCRERDYAPGQTLVHQAASGSGLFIITEGSVRISAVDASAVEREISRLGFGAAFGEQALLADLPSPATVTAIEPTHTLVLPVWDFRLTLRDFPDLAIHLIAILGQRLR